MRVGTRIKRALISVALAAGFLAVAPLTASASSTGAAALPVDPLDTVHVTGRGSDGDSYTIDAQSGPFGQDASGTISFFDGAITGTVTCLRVRGANAGQGTASSPTSAVLMAQTTQAGLVVISVVDNGGAGADVIDSFPSHRASTDCSPLHGDSTLHEVLTSGRATIVDAAPRRRVVLHCFTTPVDDVILEGFLGQFPAGQSYSLFVAVTEGDQTNVFDGGPPVVTDSSGDGRTGGFQVSSRLPAKFGIALYRDTNGNGRFDAYRDETAYQGNATAAGCPSSVTVSPK